MMVHRFHFHQCFLFRKALLENKYLFRLCHYLNQWWSIFLTHINKHYMASIGKESFYAENMMLIQIRLKTKRLALTDWQLESLTSFFYTHSREIKHLIEIYCLYFNYEIYPSCG